MLVYGKNSYLLAGLFIVRAPISSAKLLIINTTEKYYTLNVQIKKDI
ncbi:MAG: hypothetical protein BMS9Abin11_0227 [Gammaproteobacteria bacterium]|nr:MAG: hypothetical protein BMS9Abin11_0227 [Gammaproteobacteria bacterium]